MSKTPSASFDVERRPPWADLPPDTLLRVPSIARWYGMSEVTVRGLISVGRLPARRTELGHWLVEACDADLLRNYQPQQSRRSKTGPCGACARIARHLASTSSDVAEDMAVAVALHPGNVRKHLTELQRGGYVLRSDGLPRRWSLTPAGEQWLTESSSHDARGMRQHAREVISA
jgi:hypothetical protein